MGLAFSCEIEDQATNVLITLKGMMDEKSKLPQIAAGRNIVLDFDGLLNITSSGVIQFIKWLSDHKWAKKIELRSCRPQLVKVFNNIHKVIPANVVVQSFYVPYCNEQAGAETEVLYRRNFEFQVDGFVDIVPSVEREGVTYVPDVDEKSYFQFLKKK